MTSSSPATGPSGAGIAPAPRPRLRLVPPPRRRASRWASVAAYLAGLAAGSLVVAAVAWLSAGPGVAFALTLAALTGAGCVAASRVARARRPVPRRRSVRTGEAPSPRRAAHVARRAA